LKDAEEANQDQNEENKKDARNQTPQGGRDLG
jgi:hypothetical protein